MPGDDRPLILFAAPYFAPACHGGVVQIYLGLLSRLKQFRVVVVADRRNASEQSVAAWDEMAAVRYGFHVERIDAFEFHMRPHQKGRRFPVLLRRFFEFYRFLRQGRRQWNALCEKYQPDIILCGGTYSGGWLLPGNLPSRTALVNYVHGEELTMNVGPPVVQSMMRALQRWSLRRADLNIAVSQYTASLVERLAHASPSKIAVLPNFIDHQRFRTRARRETVRANMHWCDKTVLLTIARLERRKGIDQVLRSLALLKERQSLRPDWRYIIGGTGREAEPLRHLTKEFQLAEHVEFLGYIPDDELAAIYEAADVFIQPNREVNGDTEGFGVVFLEASACGLPVIGGKAGGTADAIDEGKSGLRVDGDSTSEIADAIELLMGNAALRGQFSEYGIRWARRFDADVASLRCESTLLQTLRDRRGKHSVRPCIGV